MKSTSRLSNAPWGRRPPQIPSRPAYMRNIPLMCPRCLRRWLAGAIYDVVAYGCAKGRSPQELVNYAWWEADEILAVAFGES